MAPNTQHMSKNYNGWSSYETWAVALWLDNEEGSQRYWQERAEEIMRDCDNEKDDAKSNLANEIQEQHTEANPVLNWYEIASHYVDEVEVEEEAETEA
jgi:hypothetical protein